MKKPAYLLALLLTLLSATVRAAVPPKPGDTAPNFTLQTLDGKPIELKQLTEQSAVVLVVLRGWPGYQCPLCTKQVHDFAQHAGDFAAKHAQVLMVYPGPAADLKAHAKDFLKDKQWPANFLFVLDPDYAFTNAYGLRWDAPKETAYPSTFVIQRGAKIAFAQIGRSHGGRVVAEKALAELK